MRCGGDSPLVSQCRQAANLCLGTVFALPFGSLFICPTVPESPFPNPSRQSLPAAVCLACNLSLNAPDLTAANTFGFPSPAVKELRGHKAQLKLANFLAVKKPKTALLIAGKPQSTFPLSPFSPLGILTHQAASLGSQRTRNEIAIAKANADTKEFAALISFGPIKKQKQKTATQ